MCCKSVKFVVYARHTRGQMKYYFLRVCNGNFKMSRTSSENFCLKDMVRSDGGVKLKDNLKILFIDK